MPKGRLVEYHRDSDLKEALKLREQITSTDTIFLWNENIDGLWESFRSLFKWVPAAGGVVRNNEQQILLIFRNGKWDLPKGKVEKHEAIDDAAIREVEEECGISNIQLGSQLKTTYHIYPLKSGTLVLKPTYWYNMKHSGSESFSPQLEEGITAVEYKSVDDLQEVYGNTFESIKEVLNMVTGSQENS